MFAHITRSADLDAVLRKKRTLATAITKNDIIYFAVVRLQQQQGRIILHSWRTSGYVLVIEEMLDTATRAQGGDGEGKERRSVREDCR